MFKPEMTLTSKMSKIECITMNEIPMRCIDFCSPRIECAHEITVVALSSHGL